ncbi:MAG TPA: nucleotide exchange factor GrpE [Candidatus Tyrphobacter sp.]
MFEEPKLDPVAVDESDETALLREQVAAATARADENYNRFLLATADLDNYKKRTERDLRRILADRRRTLLERFLPVIDNLERALASDSSGDALRGGIEQTLRGFEAALTAEGVRPIDVAGKPFDPRVAEAIGTATAPDGVADDTVVSVAEKGYTLDDELLRPAKVIVAKHAG